MPGGSITIDPVDGSSTVVTFLREGAVVPVVYSDAAYASAVSLPDTITTATRYYFKQSLFITPSAKIRGVEHLGNVIRVGNESSVGLAVSESIASLADEGWHEIGATGEPAFANSWVNLDGAASTTAAFMLEPGGNVTLKGSIKSGTVAAGTPAFTLPAGYRPTLATAFAVASNDLFGIVIVAANGKVSVSVGSNVYVSLDGIRFRTR